MDDRTVVDGMDEVGAAVRCSLDRVSGDEAWVSLAGELDASGAPEARAFLRAMLDLGYRSLVVDMEGVAFVDAAGLGVLTGVAREAGQGGGSLVLRNTRRPLRRLLEITGLDRVLSVEQTTSREGRDEPPVYWWLRESGRLPVGGKVSERLTPFV